MHLKREEVVKAIKHNYPERVPMMIQFWLHPGNFGDSQDKVRELNEKYPCDFTVISPVMPGYQESPFEEYPEYRWISNAKSSSDTSRGIDSQCLIEDWSSLDEILRCFPDPNIPEITARARKTAENDNTGRYRLGHFWFLFFERFWSFRSMDNALMDFYLYPDEVKRLFRVLCDFYLVIIRRLKMEAGCDGMMVSDDLGTQNNLMFSPAIFREFFKPFYKEIIDECHRLGMHFWLHTCGNVIEIMDDLIEIGLDVIHPIQKYSMDETKVAEKYSGKICFWAGMDVQYTMPYGTAEDVRREVRFMIDTYDKESGGLMMTAGNGITPDVPIQNLEAFYDEVYRYGKEHRAKFKK